ncbi:MAG TPA: cyclic nucleotide-binding domain-containing protein [Thermoanaerobaculia bacterium]|nr:cyclic nucleotide-binding domain-containing protein [Thermoanaerobaculia bacterium]
MLNWLRPAEDQPTDDVNVLIARKDYPRAIQILRAQLDKDRHNVFVRQQLAEVFIAAGDTKLGVGILEELADDFARNGFAAKSIALLKKIQRVDPSRATTEDRLAQAIQTKEAGEAKRSTLLRGSQPKDLRPAPERAPESVPSDHDGNAAVPKALTTPLFRSFRAEELVPVIQSFQLRSFEPGDIIVNEGEKGGSLFIMTSGTAKAFVRNAHGQQRKVREMIDGDFFGEISMLQGGARTATITAATPCEALELEREQVMKLARNHPHILRTLEKFSGLRQDSDAEAAARRR